MNGTGLVLTKKLPKDCDIPFGVVTVRVLAAIAASEAIVMVMGREVAFPPATIAAVTPLPLKLTAVAASRFVPFITAETVLPGAAALGEMPTMEGALDCAAPKGDPIVKIRTQQYANRRKANTRPMHEQ